MRSVWAAATMAAWLIGCAGEAPAPEEAALLVREGAEPPGAHCAAGGVAVRTGRDANQNGTLDEAEVSATDYRCAAPAPPELTRTAYLPPGGLCRRGGTELARGADTDGDGVLADAEVTATERRCRTWERMRLTPTSADAACPQGGAQVETGQDLDGDGVLQAQEVTGRHAVCGKVREGDVEVRSADELQALTDVEVITGSVRVLELAQPLDVALPRLRWVGGDVLAQRPGALRTFELSALEAVGGSVRVDHTDGLTRVALPALRSVGVIFSLYVDRALVSVDLRALASVGERFEALTCMALPELSLPALQAVGSLSLGGLDHTRQVLPALELVDDLSLMASQRLQALSLPALGYAGHLYVAGLSQLSTLELPELREVRGALELQDLEALEGVSLPALRSTGGTLSFAGLTRLRSLEAPVLGTVGGALYVGQLPALSSLEGLRQVRSAGELSVGAGLGFLSLEGLASLQRVEQRLYVAQSGLRRLGLPALESAGSITVGTAEAPNPALEELDLPHLTSTQRLTLANNPSLARLGLPAARSVRDALRVEASPRLPRCEVDGLLAQLAPPPSEVMLQDLAAGGACAPAP